MTRTEAALQLRDHALTIVRRHGSYQQAGDAKFLMWNGDSFGMMHRTPFQKWDAPDVAAKSLAANLGTGLGHAKYLAAQYGVKLPEVLPYCIDIWRGKKVFSLEWADDGRSRIINFKRGAWEAEFLALAA
jgi:hypothetical protein